MKSNKKSKNLTNFRYWKGKSGITLIALVITIIVLLILAGVSIATLTGENGILTRANESKTETEIGEEEEAIRLAYNGVMADNLGKGVNASDLQQELRDNGYTNVTAEDGTNGEITVTFDSGRLYTVDSNGNITGPTTGEVPPTTTGKTDGSFDEEKGVNTPKLGSNMELVVYDEETQEWVKDEKNSAYSYKEQTGTTENGGTSEWANAKVTINGVESYFVWIPRYAYKIDNANHVIDVKFIENTGNIATDGKVCKYADDPTLDTSTDYIIHPAFTTNADLGGDWDTELPGIWIGKYETSQSDAGTTKDEMGSSEIIQIKPNVTSWRKLKIGEMYDKAKAYSTELKSHMLKNSEWGAVAYLTHSKYGRNGTEIAVNNSSDFITGTSGGTANASSSATKYAYNDETNGVLASSTGNIYGIYDLSGGAYEYVASYYREGDFYWADSAFTTGTSDEYSTAYDGTDINTDYKQGDATKETQGWNGDHYFFVNSTYPFFTRGGAHEDPPVAGIFSSSYDAGGNEGAFSFRVCLVI